MRCRARSSKPALERVKRSPLAVHIANALGESIDSPSPDEMRAFLDALDPKDEERGVAWRG